MEYKLSLAGRSNLWFRIRYYWASSPYLFYHAYSSLRYPDNTVSKKTDLLIEGFGRSGSSFTADSFDISNNNNLSVVRNQKAITGVIKAAKYGIPVLMLIREPESVALSYKVMNPKLKFKNIILEYSNYYERAWHYNNSFITSTNDQSWERFDLLVKRLNANFNTDFSTSFDIKNLSDKVKKYQNEIYQRAYGNTLSESVKNTFNYPTSEKDKLKKRLISEYRDPKYKLLREEANSWYEKYKELSSK